MYILGGGSGAGLILLVVICGYVYWRCKNPQVQEPSPLTSVTYTAPENPNTCTSRMGAVRFEQNSNLGQGTVGIQDPVGNQRTGFEKDLQFAYASALLDQLEDLGADVKEHRRRLRLRQFSAKPQIEV